MTTPDLTAEGSGYYRTYVNGEPVSQHTTERKAIQKVYELREANPAAEVTYDHDYRVVVGGQQAPAPDPEPEPEPEPEPTPDTGAFPNEPAGYDRILHYDGDILPPAGTLWHKDPLRLVEAGSAGVMGAEPAWGDYPHEIVELPDAPTASGKVLRCVYPEAHSGGSVGYFSMWGSSLDEVNHLCMSKDPALDLHEMYYSHTFRLTSGPGDGLWEMGKGLKPTGYFGHSVGGEAGSTSYFGIDQQGSVDRNLKAAFPDSLGFRRQGPASAGEIQWVDLFGIGSVAVDEWTQLEVLAKVNTIEPEVLLDGVLKVWINGEMVLDRTDFVWRTPEDPRGFYTLQINANIFYHDDFKPRSRTDYVDRGPIVVSGKRAA